MRVAHEAALRGMWSRIATIRDELNDIESTITGLLDGANDLCIHGSVEGMCWWGPECGHVYPSGRTGWDSDE